MSPVTQYLHVVLRDSRIRNSVARHLNELQQPVTSVWQQAEVQQCMGGMTTACCKACKHKRKQAVCVAKSAIAAAHDSGCNHSLQTTYLISRIFLV